MYSNQNTDNPPTKAKKREAALLVFDILLVSCVDNIQTGEVETVAVARLVQCTGQTSENRRCVSELEANLCEV